MYLNKDKRFLMGQVRLFDYLKKLDENDLKQIKKYLNSPFFTVPSRDRVTALFEVLQNYHPLYNVSDEQLAKKLGITNKKQIGNLKVNLRKCVEDYLRQNQVRGNEQLQVLLLADSLDDLDLRKQYEKYANQYLEKINEKQVLSAEDYYLKYQLLIKLHGITNSLDNNNTYLSEAMGALSYFYLSENLINLNGFQLLSKVLTRNENIDLTLNMVKSVSDYSVIENPNIRISYFIYEFRNKKNIKEKEQLFHTILGIIETSWKLMTKSYKYEIYVYIINAAKSLAAKGVKISYKDVFDIHQFWIKKNVHLTYSEMESNLFITIAIDYCVAEKFDEYQLFVEKHTKYLAINLKEVTLQFCSAFFFFKTKQFNEALRLLALFNVKDPYSKLNAKLLELKCIYELDNSTMFNARANAFSQFLYRNNALKQDVKDDSLNFINFLNRIASLRSHIGIEHKSEITNKLEKLEKEVILKEGVVGGIWLLEILAKNKRRIK